jgi:N-acetylmuramoyl-L-alanine amidase
MYSIFRPALIVGATLLAILASGAAAHAQPAVTGVRIGQDANKTRIVVEIEKKLAFQVQVLADPYRLVVDLPEVSWALKSARPAGTLVSDFRFGLFRPGTSRLVFDVQKPVEVAKSFVLDPEGQFPYRLVIDLKPVTREAMLSAIPAPAPDAKAPEAREKPPDRLPAKPQRAANRKLLVVLDPGHGGVDPGTVGGGGSYEKDVVLAQAFDLRRQLLATGRYDVLLTRDSDSFVRLRDRIAVARDADADIFLSLHADSIGNPTLRGGSVYTLSEKASDAEAAALAAKENKADLIAGIDLNDQSREVVNILIDLAQRKTMNESVTFAKHLVHELGRSTRLLPRTHRFAGFAVLKAPDVPSALIELGYLSNRQDERMLNESRERSKISAAIVRAVDAYFVKQQARVGP